MQVRSTNPTKQRKGNVVHRFSGCSSGTERNSTTTRAFSACFHILFTIKAQRILPIATWTSYTRKIDKANLLEMASFAIGGLLKKRQLNTTQRETSGRRIISHR